ncbi:MAG: response regulator [Planctomycetota bacterium]|nr:MAG: response regulator [Planctomycetota bacterium]
MTDALRLFLVEDDDDVAFLVSSSLERAGHEVTRCRTAADALIVLGHGQYDLVLLDHRLTHGHRLRGRAPGNAGPAGRRARLRGQGSGSQFSQGPAHARPRIGDASPPPASQPLAH